MRPHLEARGRSFPAASPNHRFPPSSLDGSCCDGSRSACGYARPCLALFVQHEDMYRCLPRLFLYFPEFLFLSVYFSNDFFGTFAQEAAKGSSLIKKSCRLITVRARTALMSPPSPSQGEGTHFFRIQFKYFFPSKRRI